jgi:hypothetical protein
MRIMPMSEDPHGDYLDPTLYDDPRDNGKRRYYCETCGEVVDYESECGSLGLDEDAPLCKWCCRCPDCTEELYAELHEASEENDTP